MLAQKAYRTGWCYTRNQAYTYVKSFQLVDQGHEVWLAMPSNFNSLGAFDVSLRSALQWLRDNGLHRETKVRFNKIDKSNRKGILLQPIITFCNGPVYGTPHVLVDSAGRELWQHSPPLPGMSSKMDTSSYPENYHGKIRSRRKRKDQSFEFGDGI